MTEEYLSASEAIEILRIPPSTFHRFVKEGKIKKYYATSMSKHGEYDSHEIARLKNKFRNDSEPQVVGATDWIKNSDMGYLYNLEYAVYGDETSNPSVVRKWFDRNPFICRVLYNRDDRKDFWGVLTMLPLAEETIFQLLRGKLRYTDLSPQKDILAFEEPGSYNFYVASVIVQPQRRQHFPLLMNSVFDYWCERVPEKVIGKIYGRVLTEDGEMMVKKLFFSPLWHIADDAYMLDVQRPNPSRIIQNFQRCINQRGK